MRNFLIILFFSIFAFACSGDCVSCHPSIKNEDGKMTKGHEKLSICKTCHTSKSLENIDMGEEACGQDCWQCHSMKKVVNSGVKAHEILVECEQCHKKIEKSVIQKIIISKPVGLQDMIKDFKNNFSK